MTPERWRRITDVFHLARARDDAARIAVLGECCADDAVLRAEVEDLLAADRAAGEFGVAPLVPVDAVRLEAGSRLGQYEIVAFLAAGGMGEVYRARDIRLGRDVALKVLPDLLAHDAERLTRFKREAVVLAALNHPHVATLYGIEESHGRSALIMELVEGPTLAARLDEGPLDLVDALAMARQIADALAAAHDRGVIHRDLKPANIQLTSANDVKVLDFGLATSFTDAAVLAPPMSGTAESVGVICGTAAYMSPEQTRGGPVDRRADIWAFGCVLYEMLTGRMAFSGTTVADTLAAVLQREPDWTAFRSEVPDSLRRLVASCLEKDVKLRRRDAADLSLEIEDLIRGHREARHARPHLATPRVKLRLAAIVSLIPAAFIGGRWATSRTPESNGQLVQTTIELPTDAPLALGTSIPINGFDRRGLALSPDGGMLTYVGQSTSGARLYRRDLGSREVTAVSGTEGATFAFFSPDGRWLGFLTDDKVKKIPVAGGSPVTLCNAYLPGVASWLSDDTIFFSEAQDKRISRVSAAGGVPTVVSAAAGFASMLPDGKHALINPRANGISHDFTDVSVLSLETGQSKVVLRSGYDAQYVQPGYVVFGRGGNVFAVRFDVARGEVIGEPMLIAAGAAMESMWGQTQVALSSTGVMAYVPGADRSLGRLAWVDRAGHTEFPPLPIQVYGLVRLSPDGQKLAAHVADVTDHVWIHNLSRGESRRLSAGEQSGFPNWGADSRTIFFASWRAFGRYRLVRGGDDGSVQELLPRSDETGYPTSVSPDGAVTLNTNRSWISIVGRGGHVDRFDMDGWMSTLPDFSPDGRFVAYAWHASGKAEVFVRSYPDGRIIRQVSADGGLEPHWCRCGELFYRKADRWMSVRIRTEPELQWEPAQPAFHTDFIDTPGRSYDVSPDGKRLLVVKRAQPDTRNRINVVMNWPAAFTAARPNGGL